MEQRRNVPRIGAIRVLRRFSGDVIAAVRYLTRYRPDVNELPGLTTSPGVGDPVVVSDPDPIFPDAFVGFFGARRNLSRAPASHSIITAAFALAASSNATMTGAHFQAKPDKIYPKPWPEEPKVASVYMDECLICLTRGACCLSDSCGHLCLCVKCSLKLSRESIDLQRCPKCRSDYTRIIRTWRAAGD